MTETLPAALARMVLNGDLAGLDQAAEALAAAGRPQRRASRLPSASFLPHT
jgi:hypothetical protein